MTENISLCLKTTQIEPSTTYGDYYDVTKATSTGKVENNRTTYTWYNVNLRNLLGPIYNKYNKFNICLNNIGTSLQGGSANGLNDRTLQVKMSGLQWLSSYNQSTGNNDQNKVIKLIQLSTAAATADVLQFNEQYHTFLKGSDVVDITINLHNISTDTNWSKPSSNAYLLGHMIFNFNIQGVPEILNNRLEIEQKSTAHINNVTSLR